MEPNPGSKTVSEHQFCHFLGNGDGGFTLGEPLKVVQQYSIQWKTGKSVNLAELAKLRWVHKQSIENLTQHFGCSRTMLKEHLKRLKEPHELSKLNFDHQTLEEIKNNQKRRFMGK